jgi:hypothetical protein
MTDRGLACDIVPGSLGGHGSIPWCRGHGRYASTCAAVNATLRAALDGLVDRLDALPTYDKRTVPGGQHILKRLVMQEIRTALAAAKEATDD